MAASKMFSRSLLVVFLTVMSATKICAYSSTASSNNKQKSLLDRRSAFVAVGAAAATTLLLPNPASASGGATAGKYTTIPIAKRRYYGRVQQAVHDFLGIGPSVLKADMTAGEIQSFFDKEAVVVVAARNQAINGQCTKKDQSCKGQEVRDSRYNDMKTSMYLLGNAFRINQQKAPDNLPTVKAAKASTLR